jgi:hypothetical protein
MPKGHFDVLVPHPTHEKFVIVNSREVDHVTPTGDTTCVIHLKDGQRIATLLSREGVQLMIDDAQING